MVTAEIDNQDVIEAMQALADAAEPGDLKPKDILHSGDESLPAAVVASSLASAGWAYMYDTQTGDRSITNRNMLPAQLKKLREDGTRVFTTRKPAVTRPSGGTFRCSLHPDERKPDYDSMGLPTCRKANLTSPLQVRLHMQHRHKSAWETIEEQRKDQDRREELEFRRQLLENAGTRKGPRPQ